MFFAVLMFGEPGVEIMYPNPGFPIYESVIQYSGATPVPIALREENGFAFDAATVLSQITDRTRLIIINSPANPTGGVTPKAEIDKLVAGVFYTRKKICGAIAGYLRDMSHELEPLSGKGAVQRNSGIWVG